MTTYPVEWPPSGRYLLAVSGGADSMALLHLLAQSAAARDYELIVGHVDHGLRPDSGQDRQLVAGAAARYGLPFVACELALPAGASEAAARAARHTWLEQQRSATGATAVVTAHHRDDIIETSLMNLARGSGRRGLAPMRAGAIVRPLRHWPKAALLEYAQAHYLAWREDSTNNDLTNPRNLLRRVIMPTAPNSWPAQYTERLGQLSELNGAIDESLRALVEPYLQADEVISWPRSIWQTWSLATAQEVIAYTVRLKQPSAELHERLVQELALFAKTGQSGRRRPITPALWLLITNNKIELRPNFLQ